MPQVAPVVTGVVGLGGYAGTILDTLLSTDPAGYIDDHAPARLAAVVSSNPAKHPERVEALRQRGVTLCDSYDSLLAFPGLEAVWLPLPIDLHLSYTQKALEAGKAVMCEKPAAGCVEDVDTMIRLRDRHRRTLLIGYQDMYDPLTLALKRRILQGEFGVIRSATLHATWPRSNVYYQRADWVARFKKNGVWVMDSPAHNALSHFINLALFFLGADETRSAEPTHVRAELYRANPIENYDTVAMRLTAPPPPPATEPVPLLVLLTHACQKTIHPHITLRGDKATVRWLFDREGRIEFSDERSEPIRRHPRPTLCMAQRFTRALRNVPDDRIAAATLETARAPVVAINGASQATPVHTIDESHIRTVPAKDGTTRAIVGIEELFESCAADGRMPHETGHCPWARPAGELDLRGYTHFAGPKRA